MLRKEVKRRENVFHGSCELRPRIAVVSFGGKGSVLPGSLIGIILVTTIVNGMTMMNASPYAFKIVRGRDHFPRGHGGQHKLQRRAPLSRVDISSITRCGRRWE